MRWNVNHFKSIRIPQHSLGTATLPGNWHLQAMENLTQQAHYFCLPLVSYWTLSLSSGDLFTHDRQDIQKVVLKRRPFKQQRLCLSCQMRNINNVILADWAYMYLPGRLYVWAMVFSMIHILNQYQLSQSKLLVPSGMKLLISCGHNRPIVQPHKSHDAPVPYPTIHHSE